MSTAENKNYIDRADEAVEEQDDREEEDDAEDEDDFFGDDYNEDDDDYYPSGHSYDDDYDGAFYDPYSSRSPGICRGCPASGGCNACFH